MFDDFEFAEVDDTAPAVTGGGGGTASASSSPGDGGGGGRVASIPVLYEDSDDDDDDDSDAWLDEISLEDIRDLVNWTEDLIHEAVITSPPELVHRASSSAAVPTPAFLSEAVARGFEETGDEADEPPVADATPAPQADAPGEEAPPAAAAESSPPTSPTKAAPASSSSSSPASFVKRLQLLLSRNATAKSAFSLAPRRFRRAEGEEDEDEDDDLECFEDCPPSDHPIDDFSDDERVPRRARNQLDGPAALDTEKSPSKPSVRIAVESRWESSALSMKRDRSPAEAPAPRNAVPRERSPPRDQ